MRVRTVLAWFVIAGFLAVLVVLTRTSGGSAPGSNGQAGPTTWTIPLDPARVTRMVRLDGPDETASVSRAATGAERWTLRWESEPGRTQSWPADDTRLRAALRLIATTPIAIATDDEPVEPLATVRVTESDGRSVDIGFAPRAAGGQTRVVIDLRDANGIAEKRVVGRMPSSLPDALARTDWTAWRDETLFDVGVATVRVVDMHLRQQGTMANTRLQRGARTWAVTAPFTIDASADAVQRSIDAIVSLRVAGFEDSPPPVEVTGLTEPNVVISLLGDDDDGTLTVGKPTGSSRENTYYARFDRSGTSAVIRITAESLNKIVFAPEAFARRTPLGISAGDVARLRFVGPDGRTRLEAERTADGWAIAGQPASPDQRDALDRALRVMTAEPAAALAYRLPPEDAKGHLGQIQCLTMEGIPIAAMTVRVEDGLRLVLSQPAGDRELAWTCTSENAQAVALWASALANRG
jgi:hypothetical protein